MKELPATFLWRYCQLRMEPCSRTSGIYCIGTRKSTLLSNSMRSFLWNKKMRTYKSLMWVDFILIQKHGSFLSFYMIVSNNLLLDIGLIFRIGKKLSINRSEQNRIHDPLGFHIFVWESIISHIPQSDCCSMEFPWGACNILWRSSAMASRLQHKQHLYYEWSRFDHIILQVTSTWMYWGRKRYSKEMCFKAHLLMVWNCWMDDSILVINICRLEDEVSFKMVTLL